MRLLLDTHMAVWWLAGSARLGKRARALIEESDCAVSAASLIETRFLALAGKAEIPAVPVIVEHLAKDGIALVPLMASHIAQSMRFESSHADIYDRMLLGVAAVENRTLLTRDVALLALAKKARLGFVTEG